MIKRDIFKKFKKNGSFSHRGDKSICPEKRQLKDNRRFTAWVSHAPASSDVGDGSGTWGGDAETQGGRTAPPRGASAEPPAVRVRGTWGEHPLSSVKRRSFPSAPGLLYLPFCSSTERGGDPGVTGEFLYRDKYSRRGRAGGSGSWWHGGSATGPGVRSGGHAGGASCGGGTAPASEASSRPSTSHSSAPIPGVARGRVRVKAARRHETGLRPWMVRKPVWWLLKSSGITVEPGVRSRRGVFSRGPEAKPHP